MSAAINEPVVIAAIGFKTLVVRNGYERLRKSVVHKLGLAELQHLVGLEAAP